ncbi:MAG: hypothetical protein ALAOOOJD_00873 [bacterium]|nr:hypothetical protein [bacterium]
MFIFKRTAFNIKKFFGLSSAFSPVAILARDDYIETMITSRHVVRVLLPALVVIAACAKKEAPPVVARAGSLTITAEEFRRRFEMAPRLQQFKDIEQAKTLFLNSLIAEKLLAQEAVKQRLPESPRLHTFLEQIHREATIEALFNEKVAKPNRDKNARLDREIAAAEFMKYFQTMMVGKKTEVPPARFKFLTERLEEIFHIGEDTTAMVRKLNPSPLSAGEFSQAGQSLEANLDETLVSFDDGSDWTIKEILQRLSVGMYHLDFSNRKKFRLSLREALLMMIEQEYVYKNAVREGLDKAPEVTAEVAMWRENALAQLLVQRLTSAKNDADLQAPTGEHTEKLAQTLLALADTHAIEINQEVLRNLQVSNAGLLVLKKHFPGRMVTPLSLPLEHLTVWQEKVAAKTTHK